MKFKNHKNKLERPFMIYADCEATLKKIMKKIAKPQESKDHVEDTPIESKQSEETKSMQTNVISSNKINTTWQLGAPRIDVRPDGRR